MLNVEISSEIIKAKNKYHLKEKNGLVVVCRENVELAEAIYQIIYRKYEEDIPGCDKGIIDEKWTARMCFNEMKNEYSQHGFEELLENACKAVNRENSTWLFKDEIKEIVDFIVKKCENIDGFKTYLLKKDYPLVNDIRMLKKEKIRDNYSFATKLCHYACYHIFDNANRDRYPIFDSIVEKHLKKYYDKYVGDDGYKNIRSKIKDDNNDYINYVENIEKIIKNKEISKNGFDHLLWIYHSGKGT